MEKRAILMILDGWGIGNHSHSDVIANAEIPYINSLKTDSRCIHAELEASGEAVGLPAGQMGNSEVGHLNIGAGRIVYQDLVRINKAVKSDDIEKNQVLVDAYNYAKKNNKQVHFIGLVSDGGVHSDYRHLMKLCSMTKEHGLKDVFVHALMDGRDCDPQSGAGFMKDLVENLEENQSGKVASVCGRYYTMDRDKRWDRVKEGYDLLVSGKGEAITDPVEAIETSYKNGVTDEFIKPMVVVNSDNKPITTIKKDDVVICFNFRTDRLREITTVLTQENMPEFGMKTLPLYYCTMTRYDESFKNVHIAFDKDNLKNTLGEVVSAAGKKQIRIAETEKYAHVTFFFSGSREKEFEGEKRILIPSPKVATYDLKPSMSAEEVKNAILPELENKSADLVVLNFANADMVGHTGIYSAIKEAVETVDKCVKEVTETALKNDYGVVIIADHGNADYAENEDGSPNTAHSTNPVPIYVFDSRFKNVENGKLCDVAPTLLKIMGIKQPEIMSGTALIK